MNNIDLEEWEYQFILTLPKFHLEMLLSEVHDHGWPVAKKLIPIMRDGAALRPNAFYAITT